MTPQVTQPWPTWPPAAAGAMPLFASSPLWGWGHTVALQAFFSFFSPVDLKGCAAFRRRGGHGSPLAGPPSPKKGSRDGTSQTSLETSWVSMEAGGGEGGALNLV